MSGDSYILPQTLIDAQTAQAIYQVVDAHNAARDLTFVVTGNGTTSGGTIVFEESDVFPYTGTWSTLYTVTLPTTPVLTNSKLAIHIRVGAGLYVRPNITGAITGGGSVTVTVTGA